MYDVNVAKIEQALQYSDQLRNDIEALAVQLKDQHSQLHLLAAQRILQIHFEVFTDVANLLIDGFVMRDPGGYEDMVDIMDDEQVITPETSTMLRELIDYYRQTVKEFLSFQMNDTKRIFLRLYPHLGQFAREVRSYLQAELPKEQLQLHT